ncbi:MAG: M48 family metallopeptidase [Vicinamibacterales bacterium]|nr:M48 family metallopeptidase [Vicinamibacterales bacterium]MDP6609572.1 M48 family metallopeptidase [Vicinamibacterales bacterium]
MPPREDLQAQGDRDLRERLLAERAISNAIEQLEKKGVGEGARRQLLATAMRLTKEMAPELHEIIDGCLKTLGVDGPLELFVYPEPSFNAAAVRPEKGRLLLMVSSGALEGFEADELRFIAGHEVGHYLFDHHTIPTAALLSGGRKLGPELTLRLFAWQRYAEISADRAGLVCAGGLEPSARSLFKLASGLSGDRVKIRTDQFLAQVADLRLEAEAGATGDAPVRGDWFATHPFSPLRLRAAELCAASEIMTPGGTTREELEAEVAQLMGLMIPNYLQERSDTAEAMRRLLFAGGIAVAYAKGEIAEEEMAELERLLGLGSVPPGVDPEAVLADLPSRIESVRKSVPPLRRVQVVRDICLVTRADGHATDAEVQVVCEIAAAVEVDLSVVMAGFDLSNAACGCEKAD